MRRYINPHSVISEIRMARSARPNLAYILVEGISDQRLFTKFVERQYCKIKGVEGKSNVLFAIENLRKGNVKGVIAIIDQDYDSLLGKVNVAENVFVTDTHDIETMIIKTGDLSSFYAEYFDLDRMERVEKRWKTSFIQKVIQATRIIGNLRFVSEYYQLFLGFKGLRYKDFIDANYNVDCDKLILQAAININYSETWLLDDIKRKLMIEIQNRHDKWQVCCGHDLTNIIALALDRDFVGNFLGNSTARRVKGTTIEMALRLTYTKPQFMETDLFKAMTRWQENNPAWIIFAASSTQAA